MPSSSNPVTVPDVTRLLTSTGAEVRATETRIDGISRRQGRLHHRGGARTGPKPRRAARRDGANIIGIDICADIPSNGYPMASRDELDETVALVESVGGKMLGTVADVRDFHQVKAALDAGVEQFGRLDIVLANAGIAPVAFRELTVEEELEQWNDVPRRQPRRRLSTPRRRRFRICSRVTGRIDRLHQLDGRPARASAACRAAGLGTRLPSTGSSGSCARSPMRLHRMNIRVNTVHPTAVNTMMAVNPAMTSFLENYPDGGPHLQNPMPVGLLEPEDISAAIAYLVSDEAKYVTGVTFPVDAGFCNKL